MSKKVTTGLIEKYLERFGWSRYQSVDEPAEREGLVLTGWSSPRSREGNVLVIDPMVEKNALRFQVKEVATAPMDATPSDRLSGLLLAIAGINHGLVMGAFTYRPSSGELGFDLGIPVDADNLRYEEFEHCLQAITVTVDRYGADLREIVEGTKTAQDVMD
jgi:hypothetical protein